MRCIAIGRLRLSLAVGDVSGEYTVFRIVLVALAGERGLQVGILGHQFWVLWLGTSAINGDQEGVNDER